MLPIIQRTFLPGLVQRASLLAAVALLMLTFAGQGFPIQTVQATAPVSSPDSLDHSARWPQFRGACDNIADPDVTTELPLEWSETKNVLWKLETKEKGWSSPVVWDGRAWFTEATADGTEMFAICVDLDTGSVVWRRKIFQNEADEVREIHLMNGYASPTPVVDGNRVWVTFGSYGTACLAADSGESIWERRDLPCNHFRGPGSSPLLKDGRLYLHYDGFDFQYVVAFDALTGKTLWKSDRDVEYGTDNGDHMKAYCTPLLIEVDGKEQLISPTSKAVLAYDPTSGEEIWRVRFKEFSATAQPLFDGETLYINTGFGKAQLIAIDPTGKGDVTQTHQVWVQPKGIGSKPTPLLYEGRIYNIHDSGIATCMDAKDGSVIWTERLRGKFSASPLLAAGRLYWFDHDGTGYVTKPGDKFELLAENKLDDGCMASPVPVGNYLLVRTRSALYLLGEK